jgi:hypothetical protein
VDVSCGRIRPQPASGHRRTKTQTRAQGRSDTQIANSSTSDRYAPASNMPSGLKKLLQVSTTFNRTVLKFWYYYYYPLTFHLLRL